MTRVPLAFLALAPAAPGAPATPAGPAGRYAPPLGAPQRAASAGGEVAGALVEPVPGCPFTRGDEVGVTCRMRNDLAAAPEWYKRALAADPDLGDAHDDMVKAHP